MSDSERNFNGFADPATAVVCSFHRLLGPNFGFFFNFGSYISAIVGNDLFCLFLCVFASQLLWLFLTDKNYRKWLESCDVLPAGSAI